MLIQELFFTLMIILVVVQFGRCRPLKTKNRYVNSKVPAKYEQKELNRKQPFSNRKQYPKSNDVHYGRVVKQRKAKVTPYEKMSNMIYDGQHVINLIAKAKATKDRHTIKEHALMLDKSAAVKGGSLVNIDVFRRLLHLQTMRQNGANFNNLGQPLIDNTIDILNRMKLGSQYPKLAFEILDGQSLLDIMSAYKPNKEQLPQKKKPDIITTRKPNNAGKSIHINTNRIKSKVNNFTKFNSPNAKNLQYPFDQSENMIVDYHPIGKPMKTGRNLLDADYTEPVLDQQGESGKQSFIVTQNPFDFVTQNNLVTTTSTPTPITDTQTHSPKPTFDITTQDRSSIVTRIHDQSGSDTGIQSSLSRERETNHTDQVLETGNQGTIVSDTKKIITSGGQVLTSTPVDTSLANTILSGTFVSADPNFVSDADFKLQGEIENLLQNTSALMSGKFATQLEAPTGTASPTTLPTKTEPTRLSSTSLLKSTRKYTAARVTSSGSHRASIVTGQATKYQSLPTTQENLTTTTVSADFNWCNFLCNIMKRCTPACSGHFTSWNR